MTKSELDKLIANDLEATALVLVANERLGKGTVRRVKLEAVAADQALTILKARLRELLEEYKRTY